MPSHGLTVAAYALALIFFFQVAQRGNYLVRELTSKIRALVLIRYRNAQPCG